MSTLERFGNRTKTTLALPMSAGDTTLTVTDATNYPAAPFRIRVYFPNVNEDDEFMLVTAKAGPVFTVTRGVEGTAAVAHSAGSTVGNVLTRAGLFNIMDCMSRKGTRLERPSSGDSDLEGRLYFTTTGWYIFQDGGTTWDTAWGPINELFEPDESGFAWVNQGSASTSTVNGGVYLTTPPPGGAGENVRLRVQNVSFVFPTFAPYTVTAALTPLLFPSDQTSAGLIFRDSATSEFIFFRIMFDTTGVSKSDLVVSLDKYDNATTFNSNYKVLSASWIKSSTIWLKMEDDNTDLIWNFSNDGENFHTFDTRSRTDFLTSGPDQIGYAVNSNNTTGSAAMTLFSWFKI